MGGGIKNIAPVATGNTKLAVLKKVGRSIFSKSLKPDAESADDETADDLDLDETEDHRNSHDDIFLRPLQAPERNGETFASTGAEW